MNKDAIIISIRPKYVNLILAETKKFEYRKTKPNKPIKKLFIYSTSPEKKVVGEVYVKSILEGTPEYIWNKTYHQAGIDYENYMKYFSNKGIAYAYVLGKVTIYKNKKDLNEFGINYVPQSYVYINN